MSTNTEKTENQKQSKFQNKNAAPDKNSRVGIHKDDLSHHAVTILKTQEEVFKFYRNFQNLALFMKDLKQVQVMSDKKSHWVVELEKGLSAEWDAEITAERANEMIAWRSLDGSEVETSGTIWFRPAPAGKGTVVSLLLDYKIPGGKLTEWLTLLNGEDPNSLAYINLRRLKAFLETGEVPTIKGQSSGRDEDLEPSQKH